MRSLQCILLVGALLPFQASAQAKKRVAVMNFDYAPVYSTVNSVFGRDQDVGKGLADILVQKLVQDGTYSVIERKELDKVLTEQNFSNSNRADPSTAAKLGRILGVDAIIIGTVTQFGRDTQKRDVGGGVFGGLAGRYGVTGVEKKEAKAIVTLSARMVNTDTAEIVAVASGHAESARAATSLLGSGGSYGGGASAMDMTSQNFQNTLMGEAVNSAMDSVARQFEGRASQVTGHKVEIDGLVADVSGNQLVLNVGSKVGVKVGDRLDVKRQGREIRDPASGKVIRRVEERLGEIAITEVDADSSVGQFTGATPPKVGDAVSKAQ